MALQPKTLQVHRSYDVKGPGQYLECQGQRSNFLVNASPKPLDVATSNLAGA